MVDRERYGKWSEMGLGWCGCGLAFFWVGGCGKQSSSASSAKSQAANASADASDDSPGDLSGGTLEQRDDAHGDEVMNSSKREEARAWMKGEKHVLFKEDPKTMRQFVEDFYAAGAKQVYICDIEEHEGTSYGGGMLVVLPTDASQRGKLFEVGKRAETAAQCDPVSDRGQKVFVLFFGLRGMREQVRGYTGDGGHAHRLLGAV